MATEAMDSALRADAAAPLRWCDGLRSIGTRELSAGERRRVRAWQRRRSAGAVVVILLACAAIAALAAAADPFAEWTTGAATSRAGVAPGTPWIAALGLAGLVTATRDRRWPVRMLGSAALGLLVVRGALDVGAPRIADRLAGLMIPALWTALWIGVAAAWARLIAIAPALALPLQLAQDLRAGVVEGFAAADFGGAPASKADAVRWRLPRSGLWLRPCGAAGEVDAPVDARPRALRTVATSPVHALSAPVRGAAAGALAAAWRQRAMTREEADELAGHARRLRRQVLGWLAALAPPCAAGVWAGVGPLGLALAIVAGTTGAGLALAAARAWAVAAALDRDRVRGQVWRREPEDAHPATLEVLPHAAVEWVAGARPAAWRLR